MSKLKVGREASKRVAAAANIALSIAGTSRSGAVKPHTFHKEQQRVAHELENGVFFVDAIRQGSPLEVIGRVRAGFPAGSLQSVAIVLGVPRVELYEAVGIPRSTAENRIKANKNLTVGESDRVLRVLKVLTRATDVLGDEDSAKRWMREPVRSIGGASPLSLLDTETGYELVLDTLGRFEHGIAA